MKNNEQKLIILLGRYTFDENTVNEIKKILAHEIRWEIVLKYAINCKCVGLVYFNMRRLNLMVYIKPIIYDIFKHYYHGNKCKNTVLIEEKTMLLNAFREKHISVYPLKGARLLCDVYTDLGSRTLNDLDFLCKIEDRERIDEVMRENGYKQGEFDWHNYSIKEIERSKLIGWKINLNTLPVYMKIPQGDKQYIEYIAVDFSYALDLKKDIFVTRKIFNNGIDDDMEPIDFLFHLCCHLYKEAEESIWINAAADINLIKFCDVREFLIRNFSYDDNDKISMIILRAEEYECWEELYFVMYFLKEIYNDAFSERIISEMKKRGLKLNSTKYFEMNDSEADKELFHKRLFSFMNADIMEHIK